MQVASAYSQKPKKTNTKRARQNPFRIRKRLMGMKQASLILNLPPNRNNAMKKTSWRQRELLKNMSRLSPFTHTSQPLYPHLLRPFLQIPHTPSHSQPRQNRRRQSKQQTSWNQRLQARSSSPCSHCTRSPVSQTTRD
ncbi:hypothetical protein BLNAU_7805 [Blattamonas nauphoetae]|uniref:Uncharacterized protein n=1 Tax=Blattamonas nauphoetae TaxID=2049346 RepID=A0ABQ9X1F2_9EUKA|nr:hypothetical protein BLNAU_19583 [Blattamonas nauphoetae]KAK2957211.1 hypothetical protein BLNAU_7805 [Blattamonas nauphoetae]